MHTAYALKPAMFSVQLDGSPAADADWLDWAERDRLGIVVRDPAGGLGAALLAMRSVVAFYDAPGKKRRMRPVYPDIYLFHVGGAWATHAPFDFWPERKEIFVDDEPSAILQAINQIGITHLALPDRPAENAVFRYKEQEAALDRLKQCYLYHPGGALADADLVLRSSEPAIVKMYRDTLHPAETAVRFEAAIAADTKRPAGSPTGDDVRIGLKLLKERIGEVDPSDPRIVAARERVRIAEEGGAIEERLRRISNADALLRIA